MRDELLGLLAATTGRCHHLGLVHERYAPVGAAQERVEWLGKLANEQLSPDYADYFGRWRASLDMGGSRTQILQAKSRLLVGHGNPSGGEVGLTVQHTWGVPLIPGSALKGVLAHHIARFYGAEPGEEDPERETWRGVTWTGKRITRGPGKLYRALFGAPETDEQPGGEPGACAGKVVFHDALYVPGSCAGDRPFARDVLTVHHKGYYESRGQTAPNDYDDPIPVGFINVRPGAQFLIAVSGAANSAELVDFALELLGEALGEGGVGGKTSLGYGRLVPVAKAAGQAEPDPEPVEGAEVQGSKKAPSPVLRSFKAELSQSSGLAGRVATVSTWLARLLELDNAERWQAASALESKTKKMMKGRDPELERSRDEALARLRAEPRS